MDEADKPTSKGNFHVAQAGTYSHMDNKSSTLSNLSIFSGSLSVHHLLGLCGNHRPPRRPGRLARRNCGLRGRLSGKKEDLLIKL